MSSSSPDAAEGTDGHLQEDPEILIDFDGYFAQLLQPEPSGPKAPEDPTGDRVPDAATTRAHATVHYLYRSAVVLTEGAGEEALLAQREYSRQLLSESTGAVRIAEDGRAELPRPAWADQVEQNIRASLLPERPLDGVTLRTTLDHRLYARAFPSAGVIEISAVTYEFLRTFNLALWNVVLRLLEDEPASLNAAELRSDEEWGTFGPLSAGLAPVFLPYLVALTSDVSLAGLPAQRARNLSAYRYAKLTTELQLSFMLAHEYGHMLLHREPSGRTRAQREYEADRFAFDFLPRYRSEVEGAGFGDMWIAVHWLFGFLSMDSTVGSILGRYPVDTKREHLNRRVRMLRLSGETPEEFDHLATVIGIKAVSGVRKQYIIRQSEVREAAESQRRRSTHG